MWMDSPLGWRQVHFFRALRFIIGVVTKRSGTLKLLEGMHAHIYAFIFIYKPGLYVQLHWHFHQVHGSVVLFNWKLSHLKLWAMICIQL